MLHRVCSLNFFLMSGSHLKLPAEDLDIRPRFWVWICRLLLKSFAEVLEIRHLVQEHRPRICRLVLKYMLKSLFRYQDRRPRVSDVRPEIWNSDIRHDVVICYCLLIILINFLGCQFKDLRIWELAYKSRLKSSTGYEDPRPRVSDMRLDFWNSDIRQNVVISHGTFCISILPQ